MSSSEFTPRATETMMPAEELGEARYHLLVIRDGTSSRLDLPHSGVLRIGRDPDADITVDDGKVSREHARLLLSDGEATIADLGSRNGTRVNGDRIEAAEGARPLVLGDVVSIGGAHLVLAGKSGVAASPAIRDAASLRRRLGEEIDRALGFGRRLAVIALHCAKTPSSERLAAAGDAVGKTGTLGRDGNRRLYALAPEIDADRGLSLARALARTLDASAGLALCPDDACDADTALAVARTAAAAAEPGAAATAAATARARQLGDREVILADPAMIQLYDLIERLAASDLTVLITGETGCGKENAAFALHCLSPTRAGGPFVTINCAALQDTLLESELFGHVKGAFTGATSDAIGRLEAASGGTVFLDELGELTQSAQAKLLRALESHRITRVGDVREREVDIRVVVATNRDLEAEVAAGRFRQDLYFRVSTATVQLPPLRERPREIPILARAFADAACEASGLAPVELSGAALAALAAHDWPGNVRELKSAMEFAVATVTGSRVEPRDLPDRVHSAGTEAPGDDGLAEDSEGIGDDGDGGDGGGGDAPAFQPLAAEIEALERLRMTQALRAADGVQTRAARLIDMPLRTFVYKLKRYDLGKP